MNPQITALLLCIILLSQSHAHSHTVCIIGGGIGGASVAHFLRLYTPPGAISQIDLFERHAVVGGRLATVTIAGETFEAGGSIIHPKNYYAWNYTLLLGLQPKVPSHSDDSLSLGIWNGHDFVYKTLNSNSKLPIVQRLVSIANSIIMALRYGVVSLFRMNSFIEVTVNKFLSYYGGLESRPVFESVEAMLKWAGLFNLTTITLGEKLEEVGLSPILVEELVTVSTVLISSFFFLLKIVFFPSVVDNDEQLIRSFGLRNACDPLLPLCR